ncbi:hypothetical protein GYH30_054846 [Glycine max]|nr:hypothetical protein GYH30_054846 [Glycine max]
MGMVDDAKEELHSVLLYTLSLFHAFGCHGGHAGVVEITYMLVSSPLMVPLAKSELLKKYRLKSLWFLGTAARRSARKSAAEVAVFDCSC